MRVLVVNAGSSSLKLRLLGDADEDLGRADLPAVDELPEGELARALEGLGGGSGGEQGFDAIGHRVVHGGDLRDPVVVDPDVRRRLEGLTDLAPLHQPKSLATLDAVSAATPGVPSVACFDTAFHATLPPEAATYAVPSRWRDGFGMRRYGFHGLSHAYAARRAAEMAGTGGAGVGGAGGRIVTCHLGAGASLAAVRDGVSVDTTMGFTPLDGLVMATRSGSVDPGAVLWLVTEQGLDARDVARALEHESGLVGLAGTANMVEVVAGAESGRDDARLALGVYVHRLRAGVAAMAASLGGVDVLVFTGGVGENSPAVRAKTVRGLGFLGAALDDARNAAASPDADVTAPGARVRVLVIAAREDLEIARGVRAALA
jgi:acetate kinase